MAQNIRRTIQKTLAEMEIKRKEPSSEIRID